MSFRVRTVEPQEHVVRREGRRQEARLGTEEQGVPNELFGDVSGSLRARTANEAVKFHNVIRGREHK